MNREALHSINAWFRDFANGYKEDDGRLHQVLKFKLIHSGKVAVECKGISTDLGWSESDVLLAETIGILHDVARFPQFRKYKTLHDPISINHGEAGYEIIAANPGALSGCTPAEKAIILDSVRYHNRREIPSGVDPASLRFVELIRDADKLDILCVIEDAIRKNLIKDFPELVLNIDFEGPASPVLVEEVLKHKSGSYSNMKTLADLNLLRMTWIYDINYMPTLRRIVDRRLLTGLMETMPTSPTPGVREIARQAEEYAKAKLAAGNQVLS